MRPCVTRQGVTRLDAHAVHFVSYDGLVDTNPSQENGSSSPRPRAGSGSATAPGERTTFRAAHHGPCRRPDRPRTRLPSVRDCLRWPAEDRDACPVPLRSSRRTELVPDRDDNAYAVLPVGRIAAASRASGYPAGRLLLDGGGLNASGEMVVDETRIRADNVPVFPVPGEVRRRGALGAARGRLRPAGVTVM